MTLPNAASGGNWAIVTPGDINGSPIANWTFLLAANQSIIDTRLATIVLNLASAARATYTSGPLNVGQYAELAIDFNVTVLTGGTSPTVTFKISRIGADNVLYQVEQATALSAAGVISYNVGSGLDNKAFGSQIQVDMVLTGAPTSITFSGSIIGK